MNLAFVIISWWNKDKGTKSTNKVWNDWQDNSGQQMQNVEVYPLDSSEIARNTWQKTNRKGVVWNDSHFTCSFQASKHTQFLKFFSPIACWFGSTYMWGTFFASVWLHNIFILCQNRIFHRNVNNTKTQPRLNTVIYTYNHDDDRHNSTQTGLK